MRRKPQTDESAKNGSKNASYANASENRITETYGAEGIAKFTQPAPAHRLTNATISSGAKARPCLFGTVRYGRLRCSGALGSTIVEFVAMAYTHTTESHGA
jgi:hypothetical protein